jgi:hypothetical protein
MFPFVGDDTVLWWAGWKMFQRMLLSSIFKGKQETVAAINIHNYMPQGGKFNPNLTRLIKMFLSLCYKNVKWSSSYQSDNTIKAMEITISLKIPQ